MNTVIESVWEEIKEVRRYPGYDAEYVRKKEREMTDLAARFFDLVGGRTDDPALRQKLKRSIATSIRSISQPWEYKKGLKESAAAFTARRQQALKSIGQLRDAAKTIDAITAKPSIQTPGPN